MKAAPRPGIPKPPPIPHHSSMRTPTITRIEPLRPRGLRVRIHLDRGEPLEVALEALERSRLGTGDPLPSNARHHLLNLDADVRVRDAALNLLSYRARTRTELRRKLTSKGFRPARVDACLDQLAEKGFLDDAAVAASHVRDRLRFRPRGPARLTQELRAKGVAGDLADAVVGRVMEEEEVTESALAREAALGWLNRQGPALTRALGMEGPDPDRVREKARRRLYGFLSRRGFRGDALRSGMDAAVEVARGG